LLSKKNLKVKHWLEEAVKKGYSSRQVKRILLKHKYNHTKVMKMLAWYAKAQKQLAKKKMHVVIPKKPLIKRKPKISAKTLENLKEKLKIKKSTKSEVQRVAQENIASNQKVKAAKVSTNDKPLSGNEVEHYEILIDRAKIDVRIEKVLTGLLYKLDFPTLKPATKALLEEIRKELISVSTIAAGEITDQKSVQKIKDNFMITSTKILRDRLPFLAKESEDFLVGTLMQEMLGLGKIEFLINDPKLEEIVIISKDEVRVYHKNHGWLLTNVKLQSEEDVVNYANIIARRVGRQISILNPLLDAHVVTGDRANAVLYPIATKGNTITIRKFSRDPWTIVDLLNNKTLSPDVASLLWIAMEYEMNILFSGGTASGKTVILNACMPFIPPNHRIISMEDTRELMLPKFLYWCPLVTRSSNAESKGEVSMLDLLVNSLRMRPDRIILGEMRRQKEAQVLFEAMHTGHSVYATLHADTANETIRRLTNPPISVPPSMMKSVNLNVIMFRDRKRGVRRAFQLAEFIQGKESVTANILYRWIPEKDEFVRHNKSLAFYDELSRNTGMDEKQIEKELKFKKAIFAWLIKHNIRDLQSFGKLMNFYYTDKERLMDIIKNDRVQEIVEKDSE